MYKTVQVILISFIFYSRIIFSEDNLDESRFNATSSYKVNLISEFTVLLSPELNDHPDELKSAIFEITRQLKHIHKVIPKEILTKLQKKKIWIEWETKVYGAACCHWSRKWLTDNGYNPDKKGCVEINNAVNFVKWSKQSQPCMLLHELAHAYHQMLPKETRKKIKSAFIKALNSMTYEKVKHINGRVQRAYAMTNDKEYFAELTESYLGKNDFYPFDREELKKHDPTGYKLLKRIWVLSTESNRPHN